MKLKPIALTKMNQRMRNPIFFLFFSMIPQVILMIINLRCFNIIAGEMSDAMKTISYSLFSSEIVLLFLLIVIPLLLYFLKKQLTVLIQIILVILPVVYLFIFSVNIYDAVPSQVRIWIMPVERVIFYQFILIMPVIFYSIVSIASTQSRFGIKQEMFMSAVMLAAPPFFTYLIYNIIYNFLDYKYRINEFILPVFVIIATAVMFFAVIRLILMLYHSFENKSRYVESIVYILIGLVMPLGGLILNYYIPFPTDFQSVPVYILAVLNGIFVAVPKVGNKRIDIMTAVSRIIFFPFTLYFFIVFLPFLPLSIPAILALGAGFLILSPTLLFILHLKRIISDIKNSFQSMKVRKRAAAVAGSMLVIPFIIVVSGIMDKISINQALDYIYEPDYALMNEFKGSRCFVKHGLESLARKKSGIYLPFISGFYDWMVFDNLVLPDAKMNYIYKAFFGQEIEMPEKRDSNFALFLGRPGSRRIQSVSDDFTASKDVVISNIHHSYLYENDFIRTNVKIEMKNLTNFQEEFRTSISVPKGVFVSNYWLYIGNERVPGRIFEKKAAIWIYQMIRSAKRDPGLLFYKNPELLYLYVFPFSGLQKRITEIEFLYPRSISPEITIGNNRFRFNTLSSDRDNIIASQNEYQLSVLLSEKMKAGLPKTIRTPYFHFLVDWSENSRIANSDIIKQIKNILRRFPEIKFCSITLANYETSNITNGIIPVEEIDNINLEELNDSTEARGGFCRDRAMKTILVNYSNDLKKSALTDKHFLYSPVIIVIKSPETEVLTENDLYNFSELSPDVKYYYSYENNKIHIKDFKGQVNNHVNRIKPEKLIVLKLAGDILCTDSYKNDIIHNRSASRFLSFEIYNPESGCFQMSGPVKYFDKDELYSKAMRTDMLCREKELNPSLSSDLFKPLVMLSKETGILNQLTSYIVVENSAQWKMLEQMEKTKLKNKGALEVVNTSEPSTLILAGLFLFFLIIKNRGMIRSVIMKYQNI